MGAIVIFFHFKFDLSVLLVRLNLVAKYQGPWNYPLTRKTTRESLINLCAENCVKYYRCYFMGRHKGPNDF